ncbi:MAG: ABC transporter permease [Planctomycetes bacterium]|nr:ABC transporter permease [Planctomycetota bacterium]
MARAAAGPVGGWRTRAFWGVLFVLVAGFAGSVIALLAADAAYIDGRAVERVLGSREIAAAAWLSIWTSTVTTAIALVFAIALGYALSRARFPGRLLVDTLVDLPIVFPPLVMGLSLLIFFRTGLGRWIESTGLSFVYHQRGIVLAQFFVAASFGIRAAKAAFDEADARQEAVALTLGCSRWGAFWRIGLPNARDGIIAAAILTWARAFGLFGPLLVFVGAVRGRTEVLPTTIYLETSIGEIETALVVSLLLFAIAGAALLLIRLVGGWRTS